MEKIAKVSGIADRVLRVVQGFMIAFAAVSGIFIVLAYTVGEKIVQDASFVELGNLTLYLKESAVPGFPALRTGIVISLAAVAGMAAAGWYLLHEIRRILQPMKAGRPFESGISARVRRLSCTWLLGGAAIEVCRMCGRIVELKAYDPERLMNGEAVRGIAYNCSFNLSFVLIAAILFFLSLVFRYGESLQREADETL